MTLDKRFLDRLAAAAEDAGLADIVYGTVSTRFGDLLVAQTEAGVCRVAFQEEPESDVLLQLASRIGPRVIASDRATAEVRSALEAYLEGERIDLSFPVDFTLVASGFQRRVLKRLQKVPRGRVMTYGEMAAAIGHPRAARAAGTALARNPIPVIVPCHRVVPADHRVGMYGGGPWRKRFLLELEGAEVRP